MERERERSRGEKERERRAGVREREKGGEREERERGKQLEREREKQGVRDQQMERGRQAGRERATETRRLTAGSSSEHGDGFKQHLIEEQSDRFVEQLVPQQEAVVDDVTALTGDGHTLKSHEELKEVEMLSFCSASWAC